MNATTTPWGRLKGLRPLALDTPLAPRGEAAVSLDFRAVSGSYARAQRPGLIGG